MGCGAELSLLPLSLALLTALETDADAAAIAPSEAGGGGGEGAPAGSVAGSGTGTAWVASREEGCSWGGTASGEAGAAELGEAAAAAAAAAAARAAARAVARAAAAAAARAAAAAGAVIFRMFPARASRSGGLGMLCAGGGGKKDWVGHPAETPRGDRDTSRLSLLVFCVMTKYMYFPYTN